MHIVHAADTNLASAEQELLSETLEVTETTEETHEEEGPSGIAALGLNPTWFGFQLVHFLIVLLVFWKWVYTPLVKKLDERAETIEKGLHHAKEMEMRVAKLEDERMQVISDAKAEARKILEATQADADVRKTELLAKAKSEVERVVKDGKAQLVKEKDAMIQDARKEMVEIAIAAAKKVLEDSVDEKTSKALAEKAVDSLV